MVCIYCKSPTIVNNSRPQRRDNAIWRRRTCTKCASIFTTTEHAELLNSFMVGDANRSKLVPLSRDKLFLSIYECCKHRPGAVVEAGSLTQTVINNLISSQHGGVISPSDISRQALLVLKRFDSVAGTFYAAYHSIKPR